MGSNQGGDGGERNGGQAGPARNQNKRGEGALLSVEPPAEGGRRPRESGGREGVLHHAKAVYETVRPPLVGNSEGFEACRV